jgi:hypothetical protein
LEGDSDLLALGRALADELNRFMPQGVWLTCERWQDRVFIFTNTSAGRWGGVGVTDGGLDWPNPDFRIRGVVESVLNGVQDVVAETTGDPWPRDEKSADPLPQQWARVEEGRLVFGYGDNQFGEGLHLATLKRPQPEE